MDNALRLSFGVRSPVTGRQLPVYDHSQRNHRDGIACDLRTVWTFSNGELPRDRLEVVGSSGCVELAVGEALVLNWEGRRIDLGTIDRDDPRRRE